MDDRQRYDKTLRYEIERASSFESTTVAVELVPSDTALFVLDVTRM